MDYLHFDTLTQSFGIAASRRDLVRALASGLAALQARPLGARDVAAKHSHHKQRKNKQKKPQPQPPLLPPPFNPFGCLDVGQPCRGDSSLCCSGLCQGTAPAQGRPDTRVCIAHNAGVCSPLRETCTVGVEIPCNPNNPQCVCALTTGNAGFCGDFTAGGETLCRVCTEDADCEAEFGAGAACIVLGGVCTSICAATGLTACVPPCA
jgi:hypothetical protein